VVIALVEGLLEQIEKLESHLAQLEGQLSKEATTAASHRMFWTLSLLCSQATPNHFYFSLSSNIF